MRALPVNVDTYRAVGLRSHGIQTRQVDRLLYADVVKVVLVGFHDRG